VRRLVSHPAQRLRLTDRGLLRPGMAADVVVFDPARVADRATYEDGRLAAGGVTHVLVKTPAKRFLTLKTEAELERLVSRCGRDVREKILRTASPARRQTVRKQASLL
jgi:N-acyl-D-aspartate/D-glutamate deacylase